jgi:chitodextrinase
MRIRYQRLTQKFLAFVKQHKKTVIILLAIAVVGITGGLIASGIHLMSRLSKEKANGPRHEYEQLSAGQLKNLEKISSSACKKLYKVKLPEKSQAKFKRDLCSHGPDTAKSLQITPNFAGSGYKVPCYGDGTSGNRIQAIYAVASDKPDRYDQLLPSFRNWAGYVDAMIDKSAQKTGANLHGKWQTDSSCQLQVAKVVMSPTGDDSFGDTIAAVEEAGFGQSNRKYLIWTEDDWYCGIATIVDDDRKDPFINDNNGGPSYSRVDTPCWGNSSSAELHELFHNLGAVQNSAPHTTSFFHCKDAYDVMCYKDDPTTKLEYLCPVEHAALLDCNNDDYLHSHPPDGSYLASHWNTFDSGFLYSKIPDNTIPPTAPGGLTGITVSTGIVLNWTASRDDQNQAVSYKIFRQAPGEKMDLYASTTAVTFTDKAVKPGAAYNYFVVAYDPFNNASAQSNGITITFPSTPPPPPDTTPPPALTVSASDIVTQGFKLNWSLPADKGDIKSIIVLLNNNTWTTLGNTASSVNLCCGLQSDTTYTARLKTVDASGNFSLGNEISVKTLPVNTTAPSNIPSNLTLVQVNGAEVQISAYIGTTVGAYRYQVVSTGEVRSVDWYLPITSSPQTTTFIHPQVHPQNVNGFYIAVFNSSGQEIGRSSTMPFGFSGTPESDPPSTPSNFSVNITYKYLDWDDSIDASGKVYKYYYVIVDNVTGTTVSSNQSYSSTAGVHYLQSGRSYTAKVKAEDIWGNISAEANYVFTAS